MTVFEQERRRFHAQLLESILTIDSKGVASNADSNNKLSIDLAKHVADQLGRTTVQLRGAGQTSGNKFEAHCRDFLDRTFTSLAHLRPGHWQIDQITGRNRLEIARYDQYAHLVALSRAAKKDPELAAALGNDYTITPDVVISREPEPDETVNAHLPLVDAMVARRSSLRSINNPQPILHASISCKWTIRSDRAQNSRTEGLNLIKNRKGRLPHVVVVTGEPLPSRISAIALGTGEIDCVYHFALKELEAAVKDLHLADSVELLNIMVQGNRLRDIADLPLDLAV